MTIKIKVARARKTDPETSHEAARSVKDLRRSQWEVYRAFQRLGKMTDEELLSEYQYVSAHKQSDSGLRTRRKELVDLGWLRDTGERKTTYAGRSTIVWEAVQ